MHLRGKILFTSVCSLEIDFQLLRPHLVFVKLYAENASVCEHDAVGPFMELLLCNYLYFFD